MRAETPRKVTAVFGSSGTGKAQQMFSRKEDSFLRKGLSLDGAWSNQKETTTSSLGNLLRPFSDLLSHMNASCMEGMAI